MSEQISPYMKNMELWNFHIYIARVIASAARFYGSDKAAGYLSELGEEATAAMWNEMAEGFEVHFQADDRLDDMNEKERLKFERSLELFHKYFEHMWD